MTSARDAIDAARKSIAEGEALVDRAHADFGIERNRDDDGPLMRAWKRGFFPTPRRIVELSSEQQPALGEMIERIIEAERHGRRIAAGLGLVKLRERFDDLPADETWPDFVRKHLPFGVDRANELIGAMVLRGGTLRCSGCGAEVMCPCNCGRPYLSAHPAIVARSALDQAAAAVKAHPEKSNRAIAAEIGVSFETVRRARRQTKDTVGDVSVDVSPTGVPEGPSGDEPKEMPTQEEADESYQETLYDHARLIVNEEMSGQTRERLFAYLRRKYHVKYSQSDAERRSKGFPA